MPALLMRRSIGSPPSFRARASMRAKSVTSRGWTWTPPVASFSRSASSGRRQVACTLQPSAAYCLTNSRPIPRLAPVIRHVGIRTSFPVSKRPGSGGGLEQLAADQPAADLAGSGTDLVELGVAEQPPGRVLVDVAVA